MKSLITGGAGFIGCNLADALIRGGDDVLIYDNLGRRGAGDNLAWLRAKLGISSFQFINDDIRNAEALAKAVRGREAIYHLAAQVAVTSSVMNPREDFEVNALGTFNALEAARLAGTEPIFFYASTNKVYGGLEGVRVEERPTRYVFAEAAEGILESEPLDFHSPYGCSKGAGDQYARDYHRIFHLPTVVFRQSCIYGYRQFGVEDQGWLAHFAIAATNDRSVTIYGDGKQVRDLLFIDDLIRAIQMAVERIDVTAGQVYNIGGGPANTLSVWVEAGPLLESILERTIAVKWDVWRPGDQRIYVSNIGKARNEFGWSPEIAPVEGLRRMCAWVTENQAVFSAR